jgi:hypothetical protein
MMTLDSGEYDPTQFAFDEDMQELADRTCHRLHALFVRTSVSRDDLYYIAASAVECLTNRREDYSRALAQGESLATVQAGSRIGRIDAHAYFRLARRWAAERRILSHSLRSTTVSERRALQ